MDLSDPQILHQSNIISGKRVKHKEYVWLGIFGFLLMLLSAGIWHPMPDTIVYLHQARSFVTWDGMVHTMTHRLTATPGYALLITPFFLFDELPLVALTYFQAIMLCIYMVGIYVWARRYTPKSAVLIAGAASLHVCVWQYGMLVTTEAPFMASMIWSVILFHRWAEASDKSLRWKYLIGGVLLFCYCTLIRSAGLMIAMGCVGYLLWENRRAGRHLMHHAWSLLLWTGLPCLVVVAFVLQQSMTGQNGLIQGTYLSGLTPTHDDNLLQFLWQGLYLRLTDMGRLTIPGMFKAYSTHGSWMHVTMLVYVPLFLGLMLAWWKLIARQRDALVMGFIPFLLLHIFYARYHDGNRFLTPMLPVLMLMVWQMLKRIRIPQHTGMLVLLLLHASVAIGLAVREYPKLVKVREQWTIAEQCAKILNQDPGRVFSIDQVNNLELQIRIITGTTIRRKQSYEAIHEQKPKWVLRHHSNSDLPSYQSVWSDQEFQLLKRITPEQAKSLTSKTPNT